MPMRRPACWVWLSPSTTDEFPRDPALHLQNGHPGRHHSEARPWTTPSNSSSSRSATSIAPRPSTSSRRASNSSSTPSARPGLPRRPARPARLGLRDRHRHGHRLDGAGLAPRPAPVRQRHRGRARRAHRSRRRGRRHLPLRRGRPDARASIPERRSYATFMPFQDPDGNTWLVQEVKRDWKVQTVKTRRGRRVTDPVAAAFAGGESGGLRGPHRAIPARAPRPLLPDARLVRRGRGRGPGDVPAGVAGARHASMAARSSAPGCTRSRRTSASTRSGAAGAG